MTIGDKFMKAVNLTKDMIISDRVMKSDSFFKRFFGLMGRKKIPESHSMIIYPCNSIHTCFMRFSIDVLFLDGNCKVLKKIENLRPWRFCGPVKGASCVLEFAAGNPFVGQTDTGDVISMED
jgi:uncharacterized membrane protein (UPF0127 family)